MAESYGRPRPVDKGDVVDEVSRLSKSVIARGAL
jgi:hypothetical protein